MQPENEKEREKARYDYGKCKFNKNVSALVLLPVKHM